MEFLGLFILITGFIIGLGAVTVIDIHGFLGRKNPYWNEATIRTHKVTKPLIWLGIILTLIGGFIFYRDVPFFWIPFIHLISAIILILNGLFLSFVISPRLIEREIQGRSQELLPISWQRKITVSLIVSDIFWWGNLLLLVNFILK
jgi:hypothetical protein